MKKATILSFILLMTLASSAQVQVGVKGGANVSSLYFWGSNGDKYFFEWANMGLSGGLWGNYTWKKWAFQSELEYSDEGYSSRKEFIHVSVLRIPLTLRYRLLPRFQLEAGSWLMFRGEAWAFRSPVGSAGISTVRSKE
ncbi:MAG: hypothetical protein EAZ89_17785, partial [Bacteroidetes bacterium]